MKIDPLFWQELFKVAKGRLKSELFILSALVAALALLKLFAVFF